MKLLFLDIETAPILAHVWAIWKQDVALNQIIKDGYVLCWGAKWSDSDRIQFSSLHTATKKKMLSGIHRLLSEADAVCHYNGAAFDIPTLNAEFLSSGLKPPSPYKQIDLYTTARTKFRFPSNKLQYITKRLGIGEKVKHVGHELWIGCMRGDAESWETMKKYNIQDVLLLQKLYAKLLPWITNAPNRSIYSSSLVCPKCGSDKYQVRGKQITATGWYQRMQCQKCGGWFRSSKQKKFLNI